MQPHPSFPIRTDRTSTSSSRRRSPWMLSAASIEDFVERSKSQISPVATHATQSPAVSLRSDSEGASVYSILGTGSPARFSIERYGKSSRPSSLHSVHEDENEEGPIPERREEGPASRRVSAEIPVESTSGLKPPTDESGRRSWRNSLSGISKHGHSPRNSLHNLFSTITHDSPSSSKHSLADIAKRLKIPGHSDREGPLEIPEILTEPLSKEGSDISTGPPADQDENKLTVTVPTMTYLDTLSMKSRRSRASSRATPDVALPPRLPRLRRTKTSPYMKPVDLPGTEKKEKGALNVVRETHEELRYQRRALFLQTVAEDNHRIRRELQTTAQRISEYVESQNLSALDDTGTMKFPNNVLEAIAYDPITDVITPHGSAAYVAVEETQDRIRRQSRVVEEHLRLLQTSHAPSDRRREELADRLRVALKQLERLDGIQSSERHRLEKIEAQLPRLENLQADATLKFHAVYAATASEYPEMQHIAVMIDKYIPLLQRLTNLFWIYVGPFLDLLGTYIAAPIMKRYGPDYIFPDISDFALVPIFETEITQGDPANFKLTFPRRTFLHWLVALIFDVSSFIVCKVISDIAGFVSWIADFSIPRIQFPLLSWTSWAVFSAVRLTLFSMAVFWGATGFFVPGLLLWWTFWYLTSIYGRLSKPIYLYLATTIVLGLIAIGAFTWWVRYSSPLWEVARPILHFHPYLGGPLYPEQPDPL
ncbi:hypothetical protein SISSUDRAFT_307953 [Sistotremastrum suecicum HHB10207 ss-3]|uniref:Uncharacterized protein n=1 Tax=Sistotremastrum suecicum HHB10207 ss-3 TaxID=1314776 RepID=A0A166G8L2_9AGAM|nr:hypothetical protein SISSUDRAFT_307953 [Sistotremastrum suecicum HHB10207 ss-3]